MTMEAVERLHVPILHIKTMKVSQHSVCINQSLNKNTFDKILIT